MPRFPETVESAIRSYVSEKERKGGYSEASITDFRRTSKNAYAVIERFQPGATPRTVTVDTLRMTLEWMRDNLSVATQKNYYFYIKELMRASRNFAYEDIRAVFPADIRPNVDWLSLDDALTVLNCDKDPIETMLVSLALCHGLRINEIHNLNVSDIHTEGRFITVLGKGRGGGKFRSVVFHPKFHTYFTQWLEHRSLIAQQCRDDISDNALLVYLKGGKLQRYSTVRLRAFLQGLSERIGIEFSAHTLRRTFGREMFHSGVSVVTIAKILGHASTEMTMRYIGVDIDDQAQAMNQFLLR